MGWILQWIGHYQYIKWREKGHPMKRHAFFRSRKREMSSQTPLITTKKLWWIPQKGVSCCTRAVFQKKKYRNVVGSREGNRSKVQKSSQSHCLHFTLALASACVLCFFLQISILFTFVGYLKASSTDDRIVLAPHRGWNTSDYWIKYSREKKATPQLMLKLRNGCKRREFSD